MQSGAIQMVFVTNNGTCVKCSFSQEVHTRLSAIPGISNDVDATLTLEKDLDSECPVVYSRN